MHTCGTRITVAVRPRCQIARPRRSAWAERGFLVSRPRIEPRHMRARHCESSRRDVSVGCGSGRHGCSAGLFGDEAEKIRARAAGKPSCSVCTVQRRTHTCIHMHTHLPARMRTCALARVCSIDAARTAGTCWKNVRGQRLTLQRAGLRVDIVMAYIVMAYGRELACGSHPFRWRAFHTHQSCERHAFTVGTKL